MTLSEADSKLRHAYYHLWHQLIKTPKASPPYVNLESAMRILHRLIHDNEVQRMRAIRIHFAQPEVACIGNGLYCRTRGHANEPN